MADNDHPARYVRTADFDDLADFLDGYDNPAAHVLARRLIEHARADYDAARQHDHARADHDVITWIDIPADVRYAFDAALDLGPFDDHRPALVNLARALNNAGFGTDDQRADLDLRVAAIERRLDDVLDDRPRYDPATHVLVRRDDFDGLAVYAQDDTDVWWTALALYARSLVVNARADAAARGSR